MLNIHQPYKGNGTGHVVHVSQLILLERPHKSQDMLRKAMELQQLTLSFITLLVVWNMARAMFSNNCAARYSNSFFVNESTFDSGSSVISSCSPAGSFIECCTLCRPGTTCAGVVYLEEKCCHLTMGSGAVFRQMAVADDLKLPRVMLYDDCTIPSVSTLYYNFYFNTFILPTPG